MLCGKMRDFSSERMTELDNMFEKALELGIPEASINIEENSQNPFPLIIQKKQS